MSKTATRFKAEVVRPIADAMVRAIVEHGALRAEVAGSLRRGRADVGDIDIVLESDPDDLYAAQAIGRILAEQFNYWPKKMGEATIHCETPQGNAPALDLYMATAETWGITLLVRTGSAAHNIKLAQRAGRRLPARKFTLHGIENAAGNVIASRGELEVFAALGLSFIDPRDREAPELEHMVRQEIS